MKKMVVGLGLTLLMTFSSISVFAQSPGVAPSITPINEISAPSAQVKESNFVEGNANARFGLAIPNYLANLGLYYVHDAEVAITKSSNTVMYSDFLVQLGAGQNYVFVDLYVPNKSGKDNSVTQVRLLGTDGSVVNTPLINNTDSQAWTIAFPANQGVMYAIQYLTTVTGQSGIAYAEAITTGRTVNQ